VRPTEVFRVQFAALRGKVPRMRTLSALAIPFALLVAGCTSGSGSSTVEQTGSSCTNPAQCYPNVAWDAGADAGPDASPVRGAVVCLDRVTGGYCTHTCVTDSDCCAVPGECKTGFPQVCSPFESTGQKLCFLSCESTVVASADAGDTNTFCGLNANSAFSCRSSGGGSQNRKVCVP
jgi:hypothetical protein